MVEEIIIDYTEEDNLPIPKEPTSAIVSEGAVIEEEIIEETTEETVEEETDNEEVNSELELSNGNVENE